MKRLPLSLFLLIATVHAHAATVFSDSFDYAPPGDPLSSAGSPSWALRSAVGSVDPKIIAGSLNYPGLQTVPGDNSVAMDGTGAAGIATRPLDQIYHSGVASTVYYSLTLQVTTINVGDWGGSGNWMTGSFMMGFSQDATGNLAVGSVAAPLLIRTGDPTNASGIANDFQGFQLGTGVTAASPTSRIFDGTRTYAPGTTLFVVLSYTFGPDANDDVARLYVNPVPGSVESANTPAVLTPAGLTDVTNSQLQAFFLRNNAVEPASTIVDNLRVGTTWEDVTPIPEPSGALLILFGATACLGRRHR